MSGPVQAPLTPEMVRKLRSKAPSGEWSASTLENDFWRGIRNQRYSASEAGTPTSWSETVVEALTVDDDELRLMAAAPQMADLIATLVQTQAGLREALKALLAASWDGRTSYWDTPGTAACQAAADALAQASTETGEALG